MKKPILIAVTCVVAAALLFGAVFGTILTVRRVRAVAYYGNVTMTEGVYRYFAYEALCDTVAEARADGLSPGPYLIYKGKSFYDEADPVTGKTIGEMYREKLEAYVREALVLSAKFDECGYKVNEETVKKALYERIMISKDRTRVSLEEELSAYGIGYRDYEKAAEILYKMQAFKGNYYGTDGEKIARRSDLCKQYFANNYKSVQFLFIRSETTFKLDENGNRITNSGTDVKVVLSEEEKADRAADRATLDAMVAAGTLSEADAATFAALAEKYANDGDGTDAYYFAADSAFTASSLEELPEATALALSSEPGKVTCAPYADGVVYVLGLSMESGAYQTAPRTDCFSDFYALVAEDDYRKSLDSLTPNVTVKDKAKDIDVYFPDYGSTYYRIR